MNKNSWYCNLLIAVLVPLIILGGLELLAQLLEAAAPSHPKENELTLEMPTWMLTGERQDNFRQIEGDAKTLAWMNQFEEGLGFRVRLRPNIDMQFFNTFSLINYDLEHPFTIKSNKLGFRGEDLAWQENGGVLRIAIYGDSSSFGWGVNQDKTYAALLPSLLEKSTGITTRTEVANFSIPGDSSEFGRLIFERFARDFPADIVILSFGANDAKLGIIDHATQAEYFQGSHSLQKLGHHLGRSALVRRIRASLLRAERQKAREKSLREKRRPAVSRQRYRENLTEMGQEAINLGARKVVLLGLCTPGHYLKVMRRVANNNDFIFVNGQAYIKDKLPEIVAGELHPDIVSEMKDSYPIALRQNSLFFITSDGCHPNTLGHRLIGEELVEILECCVDPD